MAIRRLRRRRPIVAVRLLVVALMLVITGCAASAPAVGDPATEVAAFASAWQDGDYTAAGKLTTDPAATAQVLKQTELNLSPSEFTVTPGAITRTSPTSATSVAAIGWTLGDAGQFAYDTTWNWNLQDGRWKLAWAPAVVHPQLQAQQVLAARITKTTDGTLVDRDDNQLVSEIRVYSVLAFKEQIADIPGTAAQLAALLATFDPTITADLIAAGISGATPEQGYTIINLREESYQLVAAQISAIAGVSAPSQLRNLPPTKNFASMLLGQVTATASELMAGTKGWKVVVVDTTGAELSTLAEQPAKPGQKVQLTIDTNIQQAGDSATALVTDAPAVIVAIQPSTGEILAVAQNQLADALGPIALSGRYPPGSIFKIITATAGIEQAGLTVDTQLPCPGTWVVDSRAISNSHKFDLGTVTLTQAFASSCNTTFAQVASSLPADGLHSAALKYGVGLDFDVSGIITQTGQSPVADSVVLQAENGFGQGQDLISAFGASLMAATVAHGSMPMPILIRGTQTTVDQPAPARSAAATDALPVLMRAVTADGTGKSLQPFGDVYLKTGTAEYADETGAIHAHAWTIGYVGDLAFACLMVGGEDSYKTNLLAEAFLTNAGLPKA